MDIKNFETLGMSLWIRKLVTESEIPVPYLATNREVNKVFKKEQKTI